MSTFARMFGVSACLFAFAAQAQALELDGAWISNDTVCAKVFVKRGNRVSITKDADLFASGFIIDANRITGKVAKCAVKTRKEDGDVIHLVATCSNDVALQNVQFSIKADGANKIVRLFPGVPELNTTYYRCSL